MAVAVAVRSRRRCGARWRVVVATQGGHARAPIAIVGRGGDQAGSDPGAPAWDPVHLAHQRGQQGVGDRVGGLSGSRISTGTLASRPAAGPAPAPTARTGAAGEVARRRPGPRGRGRRGRRRRPRGRARRSSCRSHPHLLEGEPQGAQGVVGPALTVPSVAEPARGLGHRAAPVVALQQPARWSLDSSVIASATTHDLAARRSGRPRPGLGQLVGGRCWNRLLRHSSMTMLRATVNSHDRTDPRPRRAPRSAARPRAESPGRRPRPGPGRRSGAGRTPAAPPRARRAAAASMRSGSRPSVRAHLRPTSGRRRAQVGLRVCEFPNAANGLSS